MTIRKIWNLWGFIILPCGFFLLGIVGLILQGAWWIMSLLWFLWALDMISKKCKCPKCKYPFNPHKYKELSMFTWYYWSSDLKLKCKNCGELLE